MSHYKFKLLGYDGRGYAELPRFVFAAAGKEYHDYRFDDPEWPAIKPQTPFGLVPVLEIDDGQNVIKMSQSNSISR